MKKLNLFIILILVACGSNKKFEMDNIKKELIDMEKIDQLCALNGRPPNEYKEYSSEKWERFRDSVYKKNQQKIEGYLDKYGYLGIDRIGEKCSSVFWLIAQHSNNVSFQKKVLENLKIEVNKNNANPNDYAYLYDRIKINSGEKQLYATQVEYNNIGQAIPKKLEDSIRIDARREEYKLIPLKDYLNWLTKNHFEMNKEFFLKKGITEPNFYK